MTLMKTAFGNIRYPGELHGVMEASYVFILELCTTKKDARL